MLFHMGSEIAFCFFFVKMQGLCLQVFLVAYAFP